MWVLRPPTVRAGPTFTTCISRIRDQGLRQRLEIITPTIVQAEVDYISAAQSAQLNSIASSDHIGSATNAEMVDVYTTRMVKSKSPGRAIYDTLIASADHGRCPFCGHRDVSTLDHFLPKSHHATLTVTPVNLVPSCSDCNKAKSSRNPSADPSAPEDVPLHPYFDNIENVRWLMANVIEKKPASLRFFVNAPSSWNTLTTTRAEKHFKLLRLDALYRSQAAVELQNIHYGITQLFDTAGSDAVQRHLQEATVSCKVARLNSWQTATYEALAESDWYYAGGFR